jgi:hypothetical protein
MSNESGRNEIYIRQFVEPAAAGSEPNRAGGQWQISTSGGIYPRWRADGKEHLGRTLFPTKVKRYGSAGVQFTEPLATPSF